MAVLKNRTITRNEKVGAESREVWKIKHDIVLVMDDKEFRDDCADEQALIRLAAVLRTSDKYLDRNEADKILRSPVKYSTIRMMHEEKGQRGRPSLETQAENLSPELKAKALQIKRQLAEMGITV